MTISSQLNSSKRQREKSLPRVLCFDHTAVWSGGEIALYNLVCELDKTKFEPMVLLGAEGPLQTRLESREINCQTLLLDETIGQTRKDTLELNSVLDFQRVWKTFLYTVALAKWLKENEIDLVHTNSLKSDIIGGLAARLMSIPVVWHVRDRIADDYLPAFAASAFRLAARIIPTYVIANSAATLKSLGLGGTKRSSTVYSGVDLKYRSSVVHDGVEPAAFPYAGPSVGNKSGVIRIGLIGRISPWKGQHVFIKAAQIVFNEFKNTKFIIVGSALFNEQKYEHEVKELVSKLGLSDCVEFLGFRDDIPLIVDSFDMLVHASTTGEPFGQVIVEGMAASKPVIATNGGGVPEIVVDQETGFLIPMNDHIAMASAIRELILKPKMAEQMGKCGAIRVKEHFSIEKTARDIESVYSKLLS